MRTSEPVESPGAPALDGRAAKHLAPRTCQYTVLRATRNNEAPPKVSCVKIAETDGCRPCEGGRSTSTKDIEIHEHGISREGLNKDRERPPSDLRGLRGDRRLERTRCCGPERTSKRFALSWFHEGQGSDPAKAWNDVRP